MVILAPRTYVPPVGMLTAPDVNAVLADVLAMVK
jgi:hypothetical protein